MKKYLIAVLICMGIYFLFDYAYFKEGFLYIPHKGETTSTSSAKDGMLYIDEGDGPVIFDIRGVNLGLGKPGAYANDYAITKEEYLRWFQQIQDMGANVIRTYTIAHPTFYEAFYEYNVNNPKPLYLIHGVWVDDYLINSSYSAFDEQFYEPLHEECKKMLDVVHGRHKRTLEGHLFASYYKWDISPWVYGYIMGVEWEADLVIFTNDTEPQAEQYHGEYFYTENARNFEIFLAAAGDVLVRYETEKYGEQRAVAFSNWPTTCPLEFNERIKFTHAKYGKVDTENIYVTDAFQGAYFASYHIYPYYPEYVADEQYFENTYLEYITRLNDHHSVPVVISEFGVPTSRGVAALEENRTLARDQGHMSETEQGYALISMYEDIKAAGSAGGIVFVWQDEWFKRTWNTFPAVDQDYSPYWNDIQTNEQYFGILSFEPGKEKRICYVDGDRSEWTERDVVIQQDGYTLSMKCDIQGIYFLVERSGYDLGTDTVYIPFDITPKSGSTYASNWDVQMTEACDFILELKGKEDTRVWVQERYDITTALHGSKMVWRFNPFASVPPLDSPVFTNVKLVLNGKHYYRSGEEITLNEFEFDDIEKEHYTLIHSFETGLLRYGNGNPSSPDFDSLTDFCAGDGFVEIRLPWQLLNIGNPVEMRAHDDYYECYGVEYIRIKSIGVGVGDGTSTIQVVPYELEPLGKNPEYHERLKQSYYILQAYWTGTPASSGN